MPGPAPNPNKQRRNKKTTAAVLYADPDREVPPLPDHPPQHRGPSQDGEQTLLPPEPWSPQARESWDAIWHSPMASQYGETDQAGLLKLVYLEHLFWTVDGLEEQTKLHAEIRITRRDFGLTPWSRASLHWEVANAEDAVEKRAEKAARRKAAREAAAKPVDADATAEDELSALE